MKKIITALCVFIFSGNLFAASLECIGKVERIYNHADGRMAISSTEIFGNTDGRDVCNLTASWKGISPEVCKTWLSQLLTSYAASKNLRIVYWDSLYNQCSGQATWANAEAAGTISNWE